MPFFFVISATFAPNIVTARLLLQTVPSTSSEFAHPDVIIGLTIMAYRYSGLRATDFHTVMDSLTSEFVNDIGPPQERAANARYNEWVLHAGGMIRGYVAQPGSELPEPDLAGAADPLKRVRTMVVSLFIDCYEQSDFHIFLSFFLFSLSSSSSSSFPIIKA